MACKSMMQISALRRVPQNKELLQVPQHPLSRPSGLQAAGISALFLCILTFIVVSHDSREYEQNKEVLGWEPYKNRTVAALLAAIDSEEGAEEVLEGPECSSSLLLVVVVHSSPKNEERRMAVRHTWGSANDPSVKVVFLLGKLRNESTEFQERISKEQESFDDIIQENFIDTYHNLTIKSVLMLRWFVQNCRQAKYLFKTDDDMFVDYRVLTKSLREPLPKRIDPGNFLGGVLSQDARPIKNITDKWFMPSYLYAESTYPDYVAGAGYLMSSQVAQKLYKASFEVEMIHMEDVYVTGICAQRAGIEPISLFGFTYAEIKKFNCKTRFFMSHRMTPHEMSDSWTTLTNCSSATFVQSIFQEEECGMWGKFKNLLRRYI
nr:PREDICTED: beta-1,3-galactosyltransferase 1-like isoform X1 [Bemisia tabaci]